MKDKNKWIHIRKQSLAIYARDAGFDLSIYDEYSEDVQRELRKSSIDVALWYIKRELINKGADLRLLTKGVYVISLSNPLSIKYKNGRSQVVYIGLGSIVGRIKSHFDVSLFSLMESLSGANYDFHFAIPYLSHRPEYYKHVEYLMIKYFEDKFGSKPLLNKNSGSNKYIDRGTEWWARPLKVTGRRPLWELKPTDHSDFKALD